MPNNFKFFFITFLAIFLLLGIFILFLSWLYSARQQKNKAEKLKLHSDFQQELLQTQIEIQEQTLKTISQEIHDNIGQVLSLAKLNLNTAAATDEPTQLKINDTKQLVSKAINDLRDLSRSLHGDKVTDMGLASAISNELKILENTGQYSTQLKVYTDDAYLLKPQTEMVLFRILQEAINNTIKHAKANTITVELNYTPVIFTLTIIDDGIGFDEAALPAIKKGIGLKNMRNRTALTGGTFFCESAPGKGTTIKIQINK